MRKFFAALVVAILSVSVSAFPSVAATTDFISTWDTRNVTTDSSGAKQIKLPLVSSGTYNFSVNWGDATTTTVTSYDDLAATHTYAVAGTYTLTITGTINGFAFSDAGDKAKLLDVSQWGSLVLGDTEGFFQGAVNFNSTATDAPDLSETTSLAYAFTGATSFNGPIGNWDVSGVTSLASTFEGASSFNQDVSNWNVSQVTTLRGVFGGASSFNQPLNSWDVSSVWHFGIAFEGASSFDQDLSRWDIASGGGLANTETQLDGFLSGTALSPQNYGLLLIGWAALTNPATGVNMRLNAAQNNAPNEFGVSAMYNPFEPLVLAARAALVSQGWVIVDGGAALLRVGQSTQLEINHTNAGSSEQVFVETKIGGRNAKDFSIVSTDCTSPQGIDAGESCITVVRWAPLGEGSGLAELRLLPSLETPNVFSKVDMNYDSTGNCETNGFAGGDGTAENPYLIATTAQFNCINGFSTEYLFLGSNFKLTQDLDFAGDPLAFQEIGSLYSEFTGTLDGDNHTISGIVDSSNYSALIPQIVGGEIVGGVVKNLELVEPQFVSDYDAGAITVWGLRARIENVHVNGGRVTSLYGAPDGAGGIAGNIYGTSEVLRSSSSASILVRNEEAGSSVGGLLGWAEAGTSISESFANGPVSYSDSPSNATVRIGGLVGRLQGAEISDSYSTGTVSVTSDRSSLFVGALVGDVSGGSITHTYATGAVAGTPSVGFAGRYSESPAISESFWNLDSNELEVDPGSISGVRGLRMAMLKTPETFVGWDNWTLSPDNYPQLPFEIARVSARAAAEAAALAAAEAAAAAQAVKSPVLAPQITLQAKGKRITPNKTSKIEVEGGSGQGTVKFRSLNESICKVDGTGVITGVAPGKCEVEVVKAADNLFAASTTLASVQILTPYEKLRLAPNEIKADEIKSIRGRYLSYLRADLFGQLSVSALSALSKAQIKVITKRQMAALSPQQRMALKR